MYADLDYYRTAYIGETVTDDTTLTKYLTRATQDIDIASLGRIDTDNMGDEQLALLKNANCAQAEFYAQNGTADLGGSVSLGSFSGSDGSSASSGGMCSRAARFLALSGLLNRSVASYPKRKLYELNKGGVIPEENGMEVDC